MLKSVQEDPIHDVQNKLWKPQTAGMSTWKLLLQEHRASTDLLKYGAVLDEYLAGNILCISQKACWSDLKVNPKQAERWR